MICKESKKGGSAVNSLTYILGGSKDEPQHVTIVASSEVMIPRAARRAIERIENTTAGKRKRKQEIRKIARKLAVAFDQRAQRASSKVTMPNQGYIISFAAEDREKLTPEIEREILHEFLKRIGVHGEISIRRRSHNRTYYQTKYRTAMFIAVGHSETNCYHWHIFASRIDSHGLANETSYEHRRIVKACRELSEKYGIRMDPLPDEEINLDSVNPSYYNKVLLRQSVIKAKDIATSWEEFEKMLMRQGVLIDVGEKGITYEKILGASNKGRVLSSTYSGSQLSKELTLPKVSNSIINNKKRSVLVQECYDTLMPSINKYVDALQKRTIQLFTIAKKGEDKLLKDINDKYLILNQYLRDLKELNTQIAEERKERYNEYSFVSAMSKADPIIGMFILIMILFLRLFTSTDIEEKREEVLNNIEGMRQDIYCLEQEKAWMSYEKKVRLQEYLNVKNMKKEYRDNLQLVDGMINTLQTACLNDKMKKTIIQITRSNVGLAIIDKINNSLASLGSHYHLVPGELIKVKEGFLWKLYTDGYTSDNKEIFHNHVPTLQEYGKSYVFFHYEQKGHHIAHIEADPTNYYTKGVTGRIDMNSGRVEINKRSYRGSKESHDWAERNPREIYISSDNIDTVKLPEGFFIKNSEDKYLLHSPNSNEDLIIPDEGFVLVMQPESKTYVVRDCEDYRRSKRTKETYKSFKDNGPKRRKTM